MFRTHASKDPEDGMGRSGSSPGVTQQPTTLRRASRADTTFRHLNRRGFAFDTSVPESKSRTGTMNDTLEPVPSEVKEKMFYPGY